MSTGDEHFKNAARFVCDVPASPRRVLALAQLVEEGLTNILGRAPTDGEFTLVVSNRNLTATLRAYTPEATKAGQVLEQVVREPTASVRRIPPHRRARFAKALRLGFENFRDANLHVQNDRRSHTTLVDDVLLDVLSGLEKAQRTVRTMRGSTESVTPIFGVSRRADGQSKLFASLRVDGRLCDVQLAVDVVDLAIDAFRQSCETRVTLDAVWEEAGDDFTLAPAKSQVIGIELLDHVLSGPEWLPALTELVGAEGGGAAARAAYDARDLDWESLH